MNETLTAWPTQSFTEPFDPLSQLSNIFGVPPLIIFVLVGIVAGILVFLAFRSLLMMMLATVTWLWLGAIVLRLVPFWLASMTTLVAISTVGYEIFFGKGYSDNPTSDSTNVFVQFSWKRYGERLKRAYASKFGGANPGFNDEVDLRIAVMRTQGKGPTRTIAQDWLKNQAKFVEIPWQDLNDEASREQAE